MPDDEDRALLIEHGHDPPKRMNADWRAMAAELRAQAAGGAPGPGGEDETGAPPADGPGEGTGEQAPRRPRRRPGRTAGGGGLGARLRQGRKAGGSKRKRHPRVPVDHLIGRGWETLARLASQIDVPLGRCLHMQAPVAGLIFEDIVAGTVADRALQPLARAEDKAEKGLALVAPPMLVAALEAAQGLPEPQRKAREAFILPLLEESLVLWIRIMGDKADQLAEREAEYGPAREKAQQLLQVIFAAPAPDAPPAPEDQQAARAQAMAAS